MGLTPLWINTVGKIIISAYKYPVDQNWNKCLKGTVDQKYHKYLNVGQNDPKFL